MRVVRGTKMVQIEPADTDGGPDMFADVPPAYRAGLKVRYLARLRRLLSPTELHQAVMAKEIPPATLAKLQNDPVLQALEAERERYRTP